ncbi:MAG: glycosyltransferase family 2 protein [Anaerolineales bacterium]
MSSFPLISIILPSYNHAEYVTAAVESVLHQTFKDIELIVIDDGSKDGTPDLVERIHDPRLRLIRLEQNRLRHPRNLGLEQARGQYIAFQNSDDVWLPEKLESQLEVMKEHENILACFTDVEIIDDEGNIATNSWANSLFTRENRSNLLWLRHFFETGNCLCLTSALIRRAALEKAGGFHGRYIQLSDFDLWVRLAAFGDFHIIEKKLTYFRDTMGRKKNLTDALGNNTTTADNGNLSGPYTSSQNRGVLEYADLLENYTNAPIFKMLPQIFPDIMPVEPVLQTTQLVQLAKHAWSLNTVYHSMFADSLMARIVDDESTRKEATDIFGAEIVQEFVKRRGNMAIHFENQLSAQLSAYEQILNSRSWKITAPLRIIGSAFRKLKWKNEKHS